MTAPIPEGLNTAEFRVTWAEFLEDRAQRKKKATERAQERLLKKMLPWGPAKAVKALGKSIENGWTGVFEPEVDASELGLVHERPVSESEALYRAKIAAIDILSFCGYLTDELVDQIKQCASKSEVDRVKFARIREFEREIVEWTP